MAEPKAYKQLRDNDCARGAIGTCMQIPPAKIPFIDPDPSNPHWWGEWLEWINGEGWMVYMPPLYEEDLARTMRIAVSHARKNPWGLWVACVKSLNAPGKNHAVVMRGTDLFSDPSCRKQRKMRPKKLVDYYILKPSPDVAQRQFRS